MQSANCKEVAYGLEASYPKPQSTVRQLEFALEVLHEQLQFAQGVGC